MESFDASGSTEIASVIPQGLIEAPQQAEKNVGQSQMAEFSSSLDEVMPMMSGPAMAQQAASAPAPAPPPSQHQHQTQGPKKIPFGMTVQQYMAALAGLAAVVATSKQVQERIAQMFPNVEPGSMTAMLVTALVAALVFYAAEKFL
jgi:hypothetical protein